MTDHNPVAGNGRPPGGRTAVWRRRLCLALIILSVVYINLYGAGMLLLRRVAGDIVERQLGASRTDLKMGADIRPFGLNIHAAGLAYGTGLEGGTLRDLVISVPFFAPWQVVTELDSATYNNPGLTLTTGDVITRIKFLPGRFVYKSAVEGLTVTPAQAAGGSLMVKQVTLDYTRRTGGAFGAHDQSRPQEETHLIAEHIPLPLKVAEGQALPQLDRAELRITAEPALPLNMRDREAVAAWQQAGGTVTIAPLALEIMGLTINIAGPITLDDGLAPVGTLKLTVLGIDKGYAALGTYNAQFGLMPREQYQMLGTLLALAPQAGAGPMEFPLTIKDRLLTFIKSPILPIGQLPWDIAPKAVDQIAPDAVPAPVNP